MEFAEKAIHIECKICNETGRVQDQVAVSNGGFNKFTFFNEVIKAQKIIAKPETLKKSNDNLILVFTVFTRISVEISKTQQNRINNSLKNLKTMTNIFDDERFINCFISESQNSTKMERQQCSTML